jgi:hypothetical protein
LLLSATKKQMSRFFVGGVMTVRWVVGLVTALAFVVGLVFQLLVLAIAGLLGLLGAVVVRPGSNPLAAAYRDVRPVDRKQDW